SFFFQAEDGIRAFHVTGVQTCALPIFGISGLSGRLGLLDLSLRSRLGFGFERLRLLGGGGLGHLGSFGRARLVRCGSRHCSSSLVGLGGLDTVAGVVDLLGSRTRFVCPYGFSIGPGFCFGPGRRLGFGCRFDLGCLGHKLGWIATNKYSLLAHLDRNRPGATRAVSLTNFGGLAARQRDLLAFGGSVGTP